MTYSATITQKGQVTIPLDIRRFLNLTPRGMVIFALEDDKIYLKPYSDLLSLEGSLKTKKKYDNQKADKAIGNYLAKEYASKLSRT